MEQQDWHKAKIRVRYKDTDRMGVVYYGNYLTFFEVARAEFMRDLGFPYSYLETEGFTLVVTEAAAKYHANVGCDAMINIKTMIAEMGKVRIRFDYRVFHEEDLLLVTGYTVHACINAKMKPSRIPVFLRDAIRDKLQG